ncbi:hypothetical protein PQX77_011429, partial [Marasmius sp. AFHP31]
AYYAGLQQYVKINYATGLQDQETPEVIEKSLVLTTATLSLGAFAHALLTALIESGVIIPIFQVIYIVLNAVNTDRTHDALTIMAYMFPQVIAFVPLLIMVRVGLGLTVERNHVSGLTNPSFLKGASGSPPLFLNVQSRGVATPVVAGPADDEINLDLENKEFTNRLESKRKSRSEEVYDADSHGASLVAP